MWSDGAFHGRVFLHPHADWPELLARIVALLNAAHCYRCSVVCVCWLRTILTQTAEQTEILFGVCSQRKPRKGLIWGGASSAPLNSVGDIRREQKLLGKWQQRCGLVLSVLEQLVRHVQYMLIFSCGVRRTPFTTNKNLTGRC